MCANLIHICIHFWFPSGTSREGVRADLLLAPQTRFGLAGGHCEPPYFCSLTPSFGFPSNHAMPSFLMSSSILATSSGMSTPKAAWSTMMTLIL